MTTSLPSRPAQCRHPSQLVPGSLCRPTNSLISSSYEHVSCVTNQCRSRDRHREITTCRSTNKLIVTSGPPRCSTTYRITYSTMHPSVSLFRVRTNSARNQFIGHVKVKASTDYVTFWWTQITACCDLVGRRVGVGRQRTTA